MIAPERIEPLARACASDAPGTAIDRWRALCLGAQLWRLLANGRDVTVMVGKRTDRKAGELHAVLQEERQ